MPAALAVPLRRALFRRWQQGQSPAAIAAALNLDPRTVRRLCRRFAAHGLDGVPPDYRNCGRAQAAAPADLVQAAADLRRQHPRWGAELIRLTLRHEHPGRDVPSGRTIRRWLASQGLCPAPSGRPRGVRPSYQRARQTHAIWQVDATEHVRLRDGQEVSWLRVVEERSGAVLDTAIFPPGGMGRGHARRCA